MVMRKIIMKDISKTKGGKKEEALAYKEIRKLRKQGYKYPSMEDYKTVGKGSKIRGIGTKVTAFKGRKKTPTGFRMKNVEY